LQNIDFVEVTEIAAEYRAQNLDCKWFTGKIFQNKDLVAFLGAWCRP
jgi:hypothetical protein